MASISWPISRERCFTDGFWLNLSELQLLSNDNSNHEQVKRRGWVLPKVLLSALMMLGTTMPSSFGRLKQLSPGLRHIYSPSKRTQSDKVLTYLSWSLQLICPPGFPQRLERWQPDFKWSLKSKWRICKLGLLGNYLSVRRVSLVRKASSAFRAFEAFDFNKTQGRGDGLLKCFPYEVISMRMAFMDSFVWTFGPSWRNYLGRIRRYGLLRGGMSLEMGFEVSKAHTDVFIKR